MLPPNQPILTQPNNWPAESSLLTKGTAATDTTTQYSATFKLRLQLSPFAFAQSQCHLKEWTSKKLQPSSTTHSQSASIDTTAHTGHTTPSWLLCSSHKDYLLSNGFTLATLLPFRGVRQQKSMSSAQSPQIVTPQMFPPSHRNIDLVSSFPYKYPNPNRQNFTRAHPDISCDNQHSPTLPSHIGVVFQNCSTLSKDHFTQYSYLNKLMLLQLHVTGLAKASLNWSHLPSKTSIY